MKIKKFKNLLFIVSFFAINTSYAATDQSVNQLFQQVDFTQILEESVKKMQPEIDKIAEYRIKAYTGTKQLDINQHLIAIKMSQLMQDVFNQLIHNSQTLTNIKTVYKNNYTEEEILAYIQFLKTQEGKSIFYKSLKVSDDISKIGQEMTENFINSPEFNQKYGAQIRAIENELKPLHQN